MESFQATHNDYWSCPYGFVEGGQEYELDTVCRATDFLSKEEINQLEEDRDSHSAPCDTKLKFLLHDTEYEEPLEVFIYDALGRLKVSFLLDSLDIVNLRDFFDNILTEE